MTLKEGSLSNRTEQKDCCLRVREKNLLHSYNSDTSKQLKVSLDKGRGEKKGTVENIGIQIFLCVELHVNKLKTKKCTFLKVIYKVKSSDIQYFPYYKEIP